MPHPRDISTMMIGQMSKVSPLRTTDVKHLLQSTCLDGLLFIGAIWVFTMWYFWFITLIRWIQDNTSFAVCSSVLRLTFHGRIVDVTTAKTHIPATHILHVYKSSTRSPHLQLPALDALEFRKCRTCPSYFMSYDLHQASSLLWFGCK